MKIPIYNSLLFNNNMPNLSENLDINKMNSLNFQKIDPLKFPVFKLLKKLTNYDSLYETILVSANDILVDLFLKKKIKFYVILVFQKVNYHYQIWLNDYIFPTKKLSPIYFH